MSDSILFYKAKPWLKHYPPEVPAEVAISEISISELFDRGTERWASKTALIFNGVRISFGDLRERVDRFATSLHNIGVKKGDIVALLLLNSPEFIISFHGALKVGAIVTPISPIYVSREIKYQLENSGAETIICHDILWEKVEKASVEVKNVILIKFVESIPTERRPFGGSLVKGICEKMLLPSNHTSRQSNFYDYNDLLKDYSPQPPKVKINSKSDLAVIPYTGGTTGHPKGVMLTHYNHIACITLTKSFNYYLEDGGVNAVGYMPFYHNAGMIWNVILAPSSGWTEVILNSPDIDDIINVIINHNVSFFLAAPTLYEKLKDYYKTLSVNWKGFKIIDSGADILNETTATEWEARTGTRICDCWGMTETCGPGTAIWPHKIRKGSIGVPYPNMLVAIAHPDIDEVIPVGETGEIIVKGPNIMQGYWKNSEATLKCQAIIEGETWLRTGDLGKMDEDGYFYLSGRKGDLLKYKGYRIHAREVEEVIKNHPKVKEVAVIGIPDKVVGDIIKAFVVPKTDAGGKISEEEIMGYCRDNMAHYKVPRIIEFTGQIPKTHVGKVSRRNLREKDVGDSKNAS